MSNTAAIGPSSNAAIAGMTGFSQPQRLHRTTTGNGASGYSGGNMGSVWKGCFSGDIPAGATIDGFEIISETIGGEKGNIGSFGSSGGSEEALFSFHLWNGTTLSDAITLDNLQGGSGIVYSASDTLVNFIGPNKRHPAAAPFGTFGDGRVPLRMVP